MLRTATRPKWLGLLVLALLLAVAIAAANAHSSLTRAACSFSSGFLLNTAPRMDRMVSSYKVDLLLIFSLYI